MPIPVGQIAVFAAIAVPYVVILKMAGLPFSHTLLWLYILPPGALAWLVTRPVLEGKCLPELVVSQVRYLNEPRTWCRMAPLAERDEITVIARVWRRPSSPVVAVSEPAVAVVRAAPMVEVAPMVEAATAVEVAPLAEAATAVEVAPLAEAAAAVEAVRVAPAAVEVAPERPALERHLPTGHVSAWPQAPAPTAPVRAGVQPAARAVPPPPPGGAPAPRAGGARPRGRPARCAPRPRSTGAGDAGPGDHSRRPCAAGP